MTSLLILDDHPIVREGLRKALSGAGYAPIFEAGTVSEARSIIALNNPDVVTVDINLPDGTGFEIISWLRAISRTVAIVVLTLHDDDNHIMAAIKAGASSYVNKTQPISELVAAISHSLVSPLSFSAFGMPTVFTSQQKNLTAREFDLLDQLEKGATTKEIADALFISQATVKTHLASIYRKLEVSNRTAAVHAMKAIRSTN